MTRPSRTPRLARTLFVCATLAHVGCSAAPGAGAGAAPAPYDPLVQIDSVATGTCLDGSESNDRAQVIAAIDQLSGFTRSLAVPVEVGRAERPPERGLELRVRQVSATSFSSTTDELLAVRVPSVPGLLPAPDPADYATYATDNQAWRSANAHVESLSAEAAARRDELTRGLAALNIGSGGSEIAGCLTALRDSFPPATPVIAILASDLEQVGTPQIRGDFSLVDVVVAHTCSTVERCQATEAEWRPVFDAMGVASVTFTPVGQLHDVLRRVIGVTP